jgi:hypothetical protein
MNYRHAAALVLLGWYLLVPSINPYGGADPGDGGGQPCKVEYDELGAWRLEDSFDSADSCRSAKNNLAKKPATSSNRFDVCEAIARRAARCIASDDPRLKAN